MEAYCWTVLAAMRILPTFGTTGSILVARLLARLAARQTGLTPI